MTALGRLYKAGAPDSGRQFRTGDALKHVGTSVVDDSDSVAGCTTFENEAAP
jgi:hypothetical protein